MSLQMNSFLPQIMYFAKEQADAFSSEELISYLNSEGVSEIEMIGVDGNSCIKASAKGAVKCGFIVSIVLNCIGVSNLPRFEKTKEDLEKMGVNKQLNKLEVGGIDFYDYQICRREKFYRIATVYDGMCKVFERKKTSAGGR